MKILFLTEFFPTRLGGEISGGSEARTYYLALELKRLGHEVFIITSRIKGSKIEDDWSSIKIFRVGPERPYVKSTDLLKRIQFWFALVWRFWHLNFDVVDGNNTAVYAAASIVGHLKNKPSVYWIPDLPNFPKWWVMVGPLAACINALNQWISLKFPADSVIALSSYTKKLIKSFGIPKEKIPVVYPGVTQVGNKGRVNKIPVIISIQRLTYYKRTDLVFSAISILRERGINIRYRVVGRGAEEKNLVLLARKLKIEKQISLLGNLPPAKVMQEIKSADIFSLPSEIEGFGIVTLEAMGFGLPFVNSDIPVHREIAKKSQAGQLFRFGDAYDLADKIESLLKNKSEYKRLSANATLFAKKHTWAKAAKETLKIYQSL